MAFYFLLVAIGRYLSSEIVEWDDAEQLLHSQFLLFGYGPQPPLYDWIANVLMRINGFSILPLLLLKAMLLFAIFFSVYRSFFYITKRPDLAILAAYATFMPAQLAWEAQRTLTHTVLATTCIAMTFALITGILFSDSSSKKKATLRNVFLAITIGLGLLSKYSTGLIFFFLFFAIYLEPSLRRKLFTRAFFYSLCITFLIVIPHGIWFLDHFNVATDATLNKLSRPIQESMIQSWINALINLVRSFIGFFALPLFLGAVIFTTIRVYSRFMPSLNSIDKTNLESRLGYSAVSKTFLPYILQFAVLCLILVFGIGTAEFKDRWFTPFLFLVMPFSMVALLQREKHIRIAIKTIQFALLLCAILFVFRPYLIGIFNKPSYLNLPVESLASKIQLVFREGAVVLVNDNRLAGSARLRLPKRVTVLYADAPINKLIELETCQVGLVTLSDNYLRKDYFSDELLSKARGIIRAHYLTVVQSDPVLAHSLDVSLETIAIQENARYTTDKIYLTINIITDNTCRN